MKLPRLIDPVWKDDPANTSRFNRGDKSEFLVAQRQLGVLPISLSVAAAWMWAPALLVAATLGYAYGFWGVFWFSLPNIVAVIVFGFVATLARKRLPSGVTYAGFQGRAHSRRVLSLFVVKDLAYQFINLLVNGIAGGVVAQAVFGLPFALGVAFVLIVPLLYTIPWGFRISTLTDLFTMTVILAIVLSTTTLTILSSGASGLAAGWIGTNGYDPLFIALGLGVIFTVNLMTNPYADQTLWQRAWAAPIDKVKRAFNWGALWFAPVPVLCGLVGMAAGGAGLKIDPQSALFASASHFLSPLAGTLLGIAVLLAVIDTVDSGMSAIGAVIADDHSMHWPVNAGRVVMALLTLAAFGVALTPGLSVVGVQVMLAAVAGSTLIPGLMTLFARRLPAEPAVFWGSIVGFLVGFPVFIEGMYFGGGDIVVAWGIVLSAGVSGVVTWAASRFIYARGIRDVPEPTLVLAD